MRISDWSSDACSADLVARFLAPYVDLLAHQRDRVAAGVADRCFEPVQVLVAAGGGGADLFQHRVVEPEFRHHRAAPGLDELRSEEHTSELQSLMRISYAVLCLKKKKKEQYIKITAT